MFIELIKGVALLLALSVLQNINHRVWQNRKLVQAVAMGVLFGVISIVGMMMPIVVAPGVIVDALSLIHISEPTRPY